MVQTASELRNPGPSAQGAPAEARRREILAAASRLFRRDGFAATGMRAIAAELEMTAGSLYYYFENKQALLAYCQESTLDELTVAGAIRAGDATSPGRRLRELVVAHVVALNESHPGSLAHLEVEALAPELRSPLLAKRRAYERRIEGLVRDGVAAGEFRDVDPRLTALALLGALNWTVKWFREDGARTAAEVGERFADLFLGGLQNREST
ncbi:MAG: TetR/AcrR family transcriptional regulator [Thermoanaerobaculia bacterium]